MTPISEPRLDTASATAWYLAANPAQIDTIEYAYLEGQQGAYIETRNGGGIRVHVGTRLRLGGYAQVGTNSYPFNVTGPVAGKRVDDAWIYGGGASVLLFGTTVLQARVTQNTLRPAEGGSERTVFRFTTGLSFNGEWGQ